MLMDKERCSCKEANLQKKLWGEIIQTAAYISNCLVTSSTVERLYPYEIFFRERMSIKNLRLYGSRVFVRVSDELRNTQDDKGKEGTLVGYFDLGYRMFIGSKVMVA